ncbi:forkhead box protein I2-like [Dendrobates tinctorius]|uniref:forkhead box protein I2-like n=1 Tax=Dendrobates tinctorius TaxID=92724 RepID=UPI003CC9A8AC
MEVSSRDYSKVQKPHQPWKLSSVYDVSNHPVPNGDGSRNLPNDDANNQAEVLDLSVKLGMAKKPCLPNLSHNDYRIQTRRPHYSFLALIAMAFQSTPKKKLTLHQIYSYVANKFPFYRRDQGGWQNCIRHTLSVNDCFKKVDREACDPGRGCYWTFDSSCVKMLSNGKLKGQRKKHNESKTSNKLDSTQNLKSLWSNILAGSPMGKMKSSPALDMSPCLTNCPSTIDVVRSNEVSS